MSDRQFIAHKRDIKLRGEIWRGTVRHHGHDRIVAVTVDGRCFTIRDYYEASHGSSWGTGSMAFSRSIVSRIRMA